MDDEELLQAAKRMPFQPATDVREDVGLQVSMTKVWRRLHTAGIRHRAPAWKQHLTDVLRSDDRLAFAHEHAAKNMGVLVSDSVHRRENV